MAYAIGKTATIRNGKFIPGGEKFEVSLAETESLKAAGFEILPDSPKSDNINNKPEDETEGKLEDTDGKISETEEVAPVMGGASSKAKATSKVSAAKEG